MKPITPLKDSPNPSFQLLAFLNPSTLKITVKRIATLLASLCLLQSPYAANVVPDAISYQGRALTATGALMGAGTPVNRTVIFRIWDHPSNSLTANLVYSEQQTVTIAEGEFSVLVGTGSATAGSPLGYSETAKGKPTVVISSAFAGTSRYLGVTIDDGTAAVDNEISPRQQIVSGGFAMRAKVAESVDGLAITTAMLANNSVTTTQLGDAAITTSKLAASAVTATQIADATITTAKIADGIITTAKIADGTIATADIADGSITTAKIADSSVTTAKIADGTIATADIADGSITTAKIADGTIATADIALGAVTADRIATDAILATNIAAGAVGSSELATGVNISAGAISTTGNIGAGTAAPAYKLDVNGTANVTGHLIARSNVYMFNNAAIHGKNTLGIDEACFYPRAENGTYLQYGTSGFFIRNQAAVNTMTMNSSGIVSVGTGTAMARLNIGTTPATYTRYGGLSTDGGSATNAVRTDSPISIWTDGTIVTPLVDISSDSRIKTMLHPTDSAKDLQTLMAIQITDYQFKDTLANSNAPQKKVIAQQVEKIFPQAVSVRQGIVPDIYKNAAVKEGWVMLATDLKVGERVRLVSPGGESLEEVLEVRSDAFRTSLKSAEEKTFVYGREVSDFHSVDYDAIAMLNVSATQQLKHDKDAEIQGLARQLETVQAENAALRRELAAKDESVEARLIALEARFSKDGAPVTVSLKTARAAK